MIPGITLSNNHITVFTGSGPFGFDGEGGGHPLLKRIFFNPSLPINQKLGVTLKTITRKPLPGNSKLPEIIQGIFGPLDVIRFNPFTGYLVNSLGLKNPGIDGWLEIYGPTVKNSDRNLIFSIAGNTIRDIEILTEKLKPYLHLAIELNTSCPNIDFHQNNLDPGFIAKACLTIKTIDPDIPVILKLAHDPEGKYLETAEMSREYIGPISLNVIPCKDIPDGKKPFGNFGGVSGKTAQQLNWETAYNLAENDFSVIIPSIINVDDLEGITKQFSGKKYAISLASIFLSNPFQAKRILKQILEG